MKTSLRKRILSIFLAVLILFSTLAVSVSAASEEYCLKKDEKLPVIMISGFAASPLAKKTANGKLQPVYPPTMLQIAKILGLNANNLLEAILKFNDKELMAAVDKIAAAFVEPLTMNPDATSKYDIVPLISGAKNSSLAALKKNNQTKYIPYGTSEFFDMQSLADKVGEENVFNFMYDWRMSSKDISPELHEFIKEVCELTGSKKVNVYALSQGTHVLGTYLYDYQNDDMVNNVFLDSPAMGGSSMVADILSGKPMDFVFPDFFSFLEVVLHTERDLSFVKNFISEKRLSSILSYAMQDVILPALIYAPVVWELCAPDKYEQAKAYHLDTEANAALIEKIENAKTGFDSHIKQTLEAQNEKGSVTILAGYGVPIFSGTSISSDGVVDINYATGAYVAPFGEKLPDNYHQQVASKKNLISPDRTVDLSTAYLPERTWLIKDYYHGQIEMDSLAYALVMDTLTGKGAKDAYSHYEYPQFSQTKAPNSDVCVYFKSTNTQVLPVLSKLSYMGNTIVIENTSRTQKIAVTSVKCQNNTFDFKMIFPLILNPGQKMEVNFSGKVFTCDHFDSIVVNYRRLDAEFILNETRVFDFSICKDYAGKDKLILTPPTTTELKQLINLTKQLEQQVENIKKVIEVVSKIASGIPPIPAPTV